MVRGRGGEALAVFLDRDGVLTVPEFRDGRSFAPRSLDDFLIYEEAPAALARLKSAGFRLVVVTNQPDVGNGITERAVVEEMHRRLMAALPLDRIEVCYHSREAGCDCRKPRPGMLRSAAAALGIDYANSFMIGDRGSDVAAGRMVGCTTIFVDLGYRDETAHGADFVASSVGDAADIVLRQG